MGGMQCDEEGDHDFFVVTREQHIAVVERGKGVFRIEGWLGNELWRVQVCKARCTFHRMILLQRSWSVTQYGQADQSRLTRQAAADSTGSAGFGCFALGPRISNRGSMTITVTALCRTPSFI